MPKIKTNSGAAKRFLLKKSKKIKRKHAFKRHILTKKSKKQKLSLTHWGLVQHANMPAVRELLGLR